MSNVCKIVSVDLSPSLTKPTIVTFQNGQLQPKNESNLHCAKYLNTNENKTITTVSTDRIVYSGQETTDTDDVNTFIAIRNKKTNTVRLIQVNSASLQPQVKTTSMMLESTLNNSVLNVRSLYKEFGSKKNKRQTEQIEKMKMDATNVEEELKEAVADIEINEEDLVAPTMDDSAWEYRPRINREATNVNDVYDLKTILTQAQLDSLKDLALQVRDKSTIGEELTPFALYCINVLKASSVRDLEKYEIILYIDAVLKFFKVHVRRLKKYSTTLLELYPEIINEKIQDEFTVLADNHSRTRPFQMRDKAICHVIVLSLIALNFRLDITSLSASINAGIKKLIDISRNIGAHTLSIKNQNFITLKIPLALPSKTKYVRKKGK